MSVCDARYHSEACKDSYLQCYLNKQVAAVTAYVPDTSCVFLVQKMNCNIYLDIFLSEMKIGVHALAPTYSNASD